METLVSRFPIEAGAIEVLGYLQIAYDDGHRIDRTTTIDLPASHTGKLGRILQIPNVVFLPTSQREKKAGIRGTKKLETTQ